jgi:hypothetical protein
MKTRGDCRVCRQCSLPPRGVNPVLVVAESFLAFYALNTVDTPVKLNFLGVVLFSSFDNCLFACHIGITGKDAYQDIRKIL